MELKGLDLNRDLLDLIEKEYKARRETLGKIGPRRGLIKV
jgi:hypothetical protein